MGLVLTKGSYTKNSAGVETFTPTSATWFFENPYWNDDNTSDFALKVTNPETTTLILKAFRFSFLVANSGGITFLSSDASQHTASGNGCSMTCFVTHNGVTASATKQIPASTITNIQYSESPGQSYFTPRPGPSYEFKLNKAIFVAPGDTVYIRFKATFETDKIGENCIQISSYDSVSALPTYKIIFDANGGDGGNTQYVVEGDDAIPPEVTRDNYEFIGWTPNSGWTNVHSDLTVTANWKLKGVIWIRENGIWVKKLYPHIFNATVGGWDDSTIHKKNNSGWSDM